MYSQDNAGVIVNPKGEMKGSAITGPVAKECVSRPCILCMSFPLIVPCRLTCGRVSRPTPVPWFKRRPPSLYCPPYPLCTHICLMLHYDYEDTRKACDCLFCPGDRLVLHWDG